MRLRLKVSLKQVKKILETDLLKTIQIPGVSRSQI